VSYGNSRRLIDRVPQKLIRPGMPALYILGAVYDPTEGKFTVSTLPVRSKPETAACPPVVLPALSMPDSLSFSREETLHEPIGDNQSRNGTSPRRGRGLVRRGRVRELTGVCLGSRANLL